MHTVGIQFADRLRDRRELLRYLTIVAGDATIVLVTLFAATASWPPRTTPAERRPPAALKPSTQEFTDVADHERVDIGDRLTIEALPEQLHDAGDVEAATSPATPPSAHGAALHTAVCRAASSPSCMSARPRFGGVMLLPGGVRQVDEAPH